MVGRFTQEDPYRGDGLNLYAYVKNNPVTWYDPSGLVATNTPGYSVYGLFDNGSSKPYYIGISNDPERRKQEHIGSKRLNADTADMKILDPDVSYGNARGYEQYYIDEYGTKTGVRGESISETNRGNKIDSYDRESKTRDKDRQAAFEDGYKEKEDAKNQKKNQDEKGDGGEKC